MTLRRARPCPICGKTVALRKDGRIRWHRDTRERPGGGPANPACAGVNRLPDDHQPGKAMTDLADFERFADKLAAVLDESYRTGMHVTKAANRAVIEGRCGTDWVFLEMHPGAFGVAEGWHVTEITRTPHETGAAE